MTAGLLLRSLELLLSATNMVTSSRGRMTTLVQTRRRIQRFVGIGIRVRIRPGRSQFDVGVMGNITLTFWGAVQFFVCMEVFDRCESILTKGSFDPKATSSTHPPILRAFSSCERSCVRTVQVQRPRRRSSWQISSTRFGVDCGRWPSQTGSRCTRKACGPRPSGCSAAVGKGDAGDYCHTNGSVTGTVSNCGLSPISALVGTTSSARNMTRIREGSF